MKVKIWVVTYAAEYENDEHFKSVDLFGSEDSAAIYVENDFDEILSEAQGNYDESEIEYELSRTHGLIEYPEHSFEWDVEPIEVEVPV